MTSIAGGALGHIEFPAGTDHLAMLEMLVRNGQRALRPIACREDDSIFVQTPNLRDHRAAMA
jgi:hypothetical protein